MTKTRLIFGSGNRDKVLEIQQKLQDSISVVSMRDCGFKDEIIENGDTLNANAKIKADTIYDYFNQNCFADDTGLLVDFLNGKPGVFSARFAGENCSYTDNVQKLLKEMEGATNRNAHFKTAINLWWEGENFEFAGRCDGQITTAATGVDGFGYDPVFKPSGYEITFAEMSIGLKNQISHRAKAVDRLVEFLHSRLS